MISDDKLLELYSVMVKCRMIAERACVLARQGRLTSVLDSGVGREASIAGIAVDLEPEDTLSPSRDVVASEFLKGTPLEKIFAGLATSPNGRPHTTEDDGTQPVPIPTAQPQLENACTVAKAHKAAKNGRVAIVFCGGTQPRPGRWRRSLSLASRQSLPIIFVRHLELRDGLDNTPVRRKINEPPPEALAFGVPLIQVDGNDAVAVYRVASESIARARQRRGPTLIDCMTDVSADHFGTRAGLESCIASQRPAGGLDPIHVMESHLAGKDLLKPELRKAIEDGFAPELERATRSFANESNVRSARPTEVSRPYNPGPRFSFIPGNDVF